MERIEIKRGSAKFIRALDKVEQVQLWWHENPEIPGLAFVGRSNVGKSSLINSLFGQKTAKTSKTPGRTQKINIFTFQLENDPEEKEYILYDLPGYGHAEVSKSMAKNWRETMGEFLNSMNDSSLVVNIQDSRHPNQKSDQVFYDYINTKLVPIFLVFNKLDKLKKQKERAALDKLKPQIYQAYKMVKQIHFVSAEKKTGLDALEGSIISFLKDPKF
ncbi:MAG: ribosome biogenesis GTP-binding protein YsxC [Halobacteriovoraceae bacterium]|nr:ribosome biogenesis GTP-binding protein YsxC [Halobacteriovoraceae bacterium]|tara:strand:+ start:530 stop:1180 length:651 start_codon:yes stop_codon:yes gene_type:complete